MSEILNLGNISVNLEPNGKPLSKKEEVKEQALVPQGAPAQDATEIKTQESKKNNTTNFSFIENNVVSANFSMGISLHSSGETKQLLSIGFNLTSKLGRDAVNSGGRIHIPGNALTSVLLNVATYAARESLSHAPNDEGRKQVMDIPVLTVQKMIKAETAENDFSQTEKDFLWNVAGIKMQENKEGKLDYFYYETPDSEPKKLSKQEVAGIYSHLINMQSDQDLLKYALDIGNKLNNSFNLSPAAIKAGKENGIEQKAKENKVEQINYQPRDHKNTDKSNNLIDFEEKSGRFKNSKWDTSYINTTVEERKKTTKYHEKQLAQIDQARHQKNSETAEKITSEIINKIKEEEKK